MQNENATEELIRALLHFGLVDHRLTNHNIQYHWFSLRSLGGGVVNNCWKANRPYSKMEAYNYFTFMLTRLGRLIGMNIKE